MFLFMGLLTLTSCYSNKMLSDQLSYEKYSSMKNVTVITIQTDQDSIVRFSRPFPGLLGKEATTGIRQIPLTLFKADSVFQSHQDSREDSVIQKGKTYRVIHYRDLALVCMDSESISIPFTHTKQMEIRYLSGTNTAIAAVLEGGLFAGIIFLIANMSFSFDLHMM